MAGHFEKKNIKTTHVTLLLYDTLTLLFIAHAVNKWPRWQQRLTE